MKNQHAKNSMFKSKRVGSLCSAEEGSLCSAEGGSVSNGQMGSVTTEFPTTIPCLIYLKNKMPLSIQSLKKTHQPMLKALLMAIDNVSFQDEQII